MPMLRAVGFSRPVPAHVCSRGASSRSQPWQTLEAPESTAAFLTATGLDVGLVHRTCPEVLSVSVEDLRTSVAFLEKYVGAKRVPVFLQQHPYALAWSSHPIERLLRDVAGLDEDQRRRLLLRQPFLLSPGASKEAPAVVDFLRGELLLTTAQVRKAVLAFPRMLTLATGPPEGDSASPGTGARGRGLRQRVRFLCEAAGVEPRHVGQAVARHPQLLGLDEQTNLAPTVAYLRDLGVDLARLLAVHPHALSLNMAENVQPKVEYFTSKGVPEVGRMLSLHPMLMSLALESNIRPKTRYLETLGLANFGRALQAYPQVYTLALESNIIPTVRFLELCGYDVRGQLRLRHLAASLPGRVVPRHELWRRSRHVLPIPGWRPSIADLAVASDAAFCGRVGSSVGSLRRLQVQIAPFTRELMKVDPDALAASFAVDEGG